MNDLIKREDAIGAFEEEMNGVNIQEAIKVVDAYLRIRECDAVWDAIRAIRDCMECAKDAIAEFVPSAERTSGEWMPKNSHTMYCDVCGFEEVEWRTQDYGYCPNCGARMKGADDEID